MDLAQILTEEVWRMELLNNDSRFLLVATSHRNITSISNTLVETQKTPQVTNLNSVSSVLKFQVRYIGSAILKFEVSDLKSISLVLTFYVCQIGSVIWNF